MLIPFGLGPRNCIGQSLAKVVMAHVVGKLAKNFTLVLEQEPTPEYFVANKLFGGRVRASKH